MRLPLIGGLMAGVAAIAVVVALLAANALHYCVVAATDIPEVAPLSVKGNKLMAGSQDFHVMGVNRSGTEYQCVHDQGIFDGPSDTASVEAMASWHVNFVRIPINEDCWLGINQGGNSSDFYGAPYRQAIEDYVTLLHQHGMYAELSLMWAAPGDYQATYQNGAPDADHSPALWRSLAETFKDDGGVMLAPWGETYVGWKCFRDGCGDQATYGPQNATYQTAGTQEAVDVMRKAGYRGPIAIPCISYANQCANYNNGSWLQYRPNDPLHQIVAEAHVYGKNACQTASCFNAAYAPITQKAPMIWGETGESYDNTDCGTSWISMALDWAESHGVGYMAWTWNTWNDRCSVLISTYAGEPTQQGTWFQLHYAARAKDDPATKVPAGGATPSPAARKKSTPPQRCV